MSCRELAAFVEFEAIVAIPVALIILFILYIQGLRRRRAVRRADELEKEVLRLRKLQKEVQQKIAADKWRRDFETCREWTSCQSSGAAPTPEPDSRISHVDLSANRPKTERTADTRCNPEGAKNMAKEPNPKSVVREVGLVRLLMMFGLSAVLANMLVAAWNKIKHNFEDDCDGAA